MKFCNFCYLFCCSRCQHTGRVNNKSSAINSSNKTTGGPAALVGLQHVFLLSAGSLTILILRSVAVGF
jgi:hypothetical protein